METKLYYSEQRRCEGSPDANYPRSQWVEFDRSQSCHSDGASTQPSSGATGYWQGSQDWSEKTNFCPQVKSGNKKWVHYIDKFTFRFLVKQTIEERIQGMLKNYHQEHSPEDQGSHSTEENLLTIQDLRNIFVDDDTVEFNRLQEEPELS